MIENALYVWDLFLDSEKHEASRRSIIEKLDSLSIVGFRVTSFQHFPDEKIITFHLQREKKETSPPAPPATIAD